MVADSSLIGGLRIGVTYCGRFTLLERMRSARSSPHTAVAGGVITLETGMAMRESGMVGSVVTTRKLSGEKSSPKVAVEQSITVEEIDAAQWRAVATRFGASSAPEQNATSSPI